MVIQMKWVHLLTILAFSCSVSGEGFSDFGGFFLKEPDCACIKVNPQNSCLVSLKLYRSRPKCDICYRETSCSPVQWSYRCTEYGEVPSERCSVSSVYGFVEDKPLGDPWNASFVGCALRKTTIIMPQGNPSEIPKKKEVFEERLASKCRNACHNCTCLPLNLTSPEATEKFVDELPRLRTGEPDFHFPATDGPGVDLYIRPMTLAYQKFHRDFSPTPVFSFGASLFDGGIQTEAGTPIYVDWINRLPNNHVLPVDESIIHHRSALPEVQTVVHAHGAHTSPTSDGWPLDCRASTPGNNSQVFRYRNDQGPTFTIFHDHCFGITRLNNQAGLTAPFFITEPEMERLLPQGEFHVALAIKDFDFYSNGMIAYPDQSAEEEGEHNPAHTIDDHIHQENVMFNEIQRPSTIPEYFGAFLTVNGRVWPLLNVKRAVYRFSIVNVCNSRFLVLQLIRTKGTGSVPTMTVVGGDRGLLEKPHPTRQLILGPLERSTVLIDFTSESDGAQIELRNAASDEPFSTEEESVGNCEGSSDCERPTGEIMRFHVQASRYTRYKVPISLPPTSGYPVTTPTSQTRLITLDEGEDEIGRLKLLINNRSWSPEAFEDLKPKFGTSEIWCFKNLTPDTHPMHIHLIAFQVIHRIMIKTGEIFGPEEAENGFKDVVRAYAGFTTCVRTTPFDIPGKYLVHCHILEHEDWEMMQTFEVIHSMASNDFGPSTAPRESIDTDCLPNSPSADVIALPVGAIVGIVLGSLLLVGIVVGSIMYGLRRNNGA